MQQFCPIRNQTKVVGEYSSFLRTPTERDKTSKKVQQSWLSRVHSGQSPLAPKSIDNGTDWRVFLWLALVMGPEVASRRKGKNTNRLSWQFRVLTLRLHSFIIPACFSNTSQAQLYTMSCTFCLEESIFQQIPSYSMKSGLTNPCSIQFVQAQFQSVSLAIFSRKTATWTKLLGLDLAPDVQTLTPGCPGVKALKTVTSLN